jgi:hypothetical protein
MAGKAEQAAMEAFVDNLGVDAFPHAIDGDGSIWAQFDVVSQPAFAFIDDDGTITVHNGGLGIDGLSSRIEELTAT